MSKLNTDPEKTMRQQIKDFVKKSPQNKLVHVDDEIIFTEPLVGFASGDDALFKKYKHIIGDFHLTPAEWLSKKIEVPPRKVSVIAWILPISQKTRESNQKQDKLPSKRWAHTRNYGEKFNNQLRRYIVSFLEDNGYQALAPMLRESFSWKESSEIGIASNWSERHAMYAAGLGTFGLCDGLITPAGKAMRCGSVITNLSLAPAERSYAGHNEYCLFLSEGQCGKCIERCPGQAITVAGHSKKKCLQYQQKFIDPAQWQVDVAGCGLCQTGVPCESGLPSLK